MSSKTQCQSTEQTKTLENILDIELKICQILNIQVADVKLQPPQFNLQGLNVFKTLLRKIYNRLLVNSSPILKVEDVDDRSDVFEKIQEKQAYQQIEDLLQKEESKNRTLLRKEFEFKEFQNSIIDELNDEKVANQKLNQQLNKLTQELQQKTLEIMHLKNQTRAYQRGHKEFLHQERSQTLSRIGFYSTGAVNGLIGNEIVREQKKAATSRQKQLHKLNPKKSRQFNKEKALYALYNNHKKNHSETMNGPSNFDKIKKGSISQKNTAKKGQLKDLNSIEYSNKKILHSRRKSEQFVKKTPSQREGRESKLHRKKKDEIIERIQF